MVAALARFSENNPRAKRIIVKVINVFLIELNLK
jgi:hypothetical protein